MSEASDLARHMEGVARLLLGEPNKAMSSKIELRFGSNGSLSVDLKKGVAADHESGEGGGVLWLIQRQTGRANGAALDWMRENGFVVEDRREQHPEPRRQGGGERRDVEATYDYVGETGDLLYQVVRWVFTDADGRPIMTKDGQKRKKTFTQRRPSGEPGIWINGLEADTYMRKAGGNWSRFDEDKFKAWGCTEKREFPAAPDPVVYRLPDVIEALADERLVLIVEGEKKAEALWALGIPATCNAGGSKKWREEFNDLFRAANVVVLPDNDDTGRQHAGIIAAGLNGIAAKVRMLDLARHWRECPPKGDIADWLTAGGTANALFDLIKATPPWAPALVSKYGALSWDQLDDAGPEYEYVIDDWMTVGDKSVIGGPSGSGKSFLAIHAAMAIALGTDFFGCKIRAPGLVVYQAGEGVRGIKKRLRAYRKHFGIPANERVPFVLLQSNIDLYRADGDTSGLITEIKAIEALYGLPVRAFFIDTLATAQGGADENSGKDMAAVMDNVSRISRETGAHVCLVHHMNAAGTKLRGHTSVYANIDQVIFVTRDEVTKIRTAVLGKMKDDEDELKVRFELASIEVGRRADDNKAITSCVCVQVGEREILQKQTAAAGYALRGKEEPIFKALMNAMKEKPVIPTAEMIADGVPADAVAVNYEDWRDAYKRVGSPDKDGGAQNDEAIRKMFEREVIKGGTHLLKHQVMGWSRPWLWWTGKHIRGFPETAPALAPRGPVADENRTWGDDWGGDDAFGFGQ